MQTGYTCIQSGGVMPCGRGRLMEVKSPRSKRTIERLTNKIRYGSVFGFVQVDIEVPEDLYDKFSEMAPFFVVGGISEIPEIMKQYLKIQGVKRIKTQGSF